jgi:hypothetical protein
LDEDIEDDKSTRKRDQGKISKWKKPPLGSLEGEGRKDRMAKPEKNGSS